MSAPDLVTFDGKQIVITIPVDALPIAAGIAWDAYAGNSSRLQISHLDLFAREFVLALGRESETGDTLVHRMLDQAVVDAVEGGADGCFLEPRVIAP